MKHYLRVFSKNIYVLVAVVVAVHALLNMLGNTLERDAIGDVVNVYAPWADSIHPHTKWLGVAAPWVYPFVAWVPILIAHWLLPFDYLKSWVVMATLLNLIAVGQLVAWGRRPAAFKAAWFYLLFLALLGPVAITRLDGISASLAILGIAGIVTVAATADRAAGIAARASGSFSISIVWFTLAAWLKVWPLALVLAVLQKGRNFREQLFVIGATCAGILGVGVLLGGDANLFSFITMQSDRGLQVESPVAGIWVFLAFFRLNNALIYFDEPLMTYQVSGDGAKLVASLMTLALAVAISITAWLIFKALRAGADTYRLIALASLTATLDLIVFNKVGSPQYQLWLAAPVMLGLALGLKNWRKPTVAVLSLGLLTQLVYPIFYVDLVSGLAPGAVLILGLRNLLLIALLVWANVQLGKLGKHSRTLPRRASIRN